VVGALLVGVPALSLGVWSMAPWWTPQPDEVLHIELGATEPAVVVDVFWPAEEKRNSRCSAVLLLPGVEGAKYGAADHYPRARQLAREGHAAFVVHYLEPCGYEHLYLLTEDGQRLDKDKVDAVIRRDHQDWHHAVTQVLTHIASRPEIDPQRIGVLGYSLGCFVGISACDAANRDDSVPDIAAFVGNWGSRYEHVQCDASFCACRLFHGQEDDIVPVDWPQQFAGELQEAGVDVKLHVFPGEGHVVRNRAAWREAREFFKQQLQATKMAHKAPDRCLLAVPFIPASLELRNLCY
jgi:dienelactone hydrolase